MKVFRGGLLVFLLVLIGSTSVMAEETTEYIEDEIGIRYEVPSNIISFTRNSGISDDVMKALGYTTDDYKEHLIETMVEEDTYMIAFDANATYRIYLNSVHSSENSYSAMSDEEILRLVDEGLEGELVELGTEVKGKSVFNENNHKFAVVELISDTGDCYLYATVENNQAYYFYIRAYSGGITDMHRSLIKQIAGSSEFIEKKDTPEQTVASTDLSDDSNKEASKGNFNLISTIIKLAGIIVGVLVLSIIIMMIVHRLTNRKKTPKIHYSTRRNAVFEERLKRVMRDDYDEK